VPKAAFKRATLTKQRDFWFSEETANIPISIPYRYFFEREPYKKCPESFYILAGHFSP
jgi:hypothetical protein